MSNQPNLAFNPRAARVILSAIFATTVFYAVIGFAMKRTGIIPENGFSDMPPESTRVISIALIAAGGMTALASFAIRRLMLRRLGPDGGTPQQRAQAALISMVLAEASGIMGLVVVFLTGNLSAALVLWGIAIAAGIFHFPTRATLRSDEGTD